MSKLSLPLLATLPLVASCATDESVSLPETDDQVTSAIEKENGGLDTNDEAPMFDSAALYAAAGIEADAPETDVMSAQVGDMERLAGARVRNVVIVWGRLPADPTETEVRDWSGRLELNRGGMAIRRRIAFEPATGDRVLPRTDRARIDFVSRTRPHADGLVLTIVDDRPGDGPLTLTYRPADGSGDHVLELRDLADGPIVTDVGDRGDRIILSARDRDPCDHGFMRGRWHALGERGGVLMGVVADEDGDPIGHVRGFYGTRKSGEQVFFAKFIGAEGGFRGIMAGTWAEGHFKGRWLTRAGEHGRVGGVYFRHADIRGGHFMARWGETSCTNR